jgi:hypothetical protein
VVKLTAGGGEGGNTKLRVVWPHTDIELGTSTGGEGGGGGGCSVGERAGSWFPNTDGP